MTSGQVDPKCRVWGGSPTSVFSDFDRRAKSEKTASVATLALLAVLCVFRKSLLKSINFLYKQLYTSLLVIYAKRVSFYSFEGAQLWMIK